MPPAARSTRYGRVIHTPPPRDALTLGQAQDLQDQGGPMSAESSGEESVTPPEPQTDDLAGHEEDTSSLLDILRSIPGTQVAYDDDEPSGDEACQCECEYDCPTHRWLVT